MRQPALVRPHIIVVLAMSADGKIADAARSAARFPSANDKAHLEQQIATADATLFGAGTLRAYGTTLPVTNPDLIAMRRSRHQPDQPIQIVCSATGNLEAHSRFFQQPIPRWLVTTSQGAQTWQANADQQTDERSASEQTLFHQVLVAEHPVNWHSLMRNLRTGASARSAGTSRSSIGRLVVMGGGELVASLLAHHLIDELYLTVCPLLIGGATAPTPVGGSGFTLPKTPQLKLESAQTQGHEVFLHYRVCKD
ncbi:MAG: RibD family protein [Phormidesmis sp.]